MKSIFCTYKSLEDTASYTLHQNDVNLTLTGLADHPVLHIIQAADILPLPRAAVQSHAYIQGHKVRLGRAVLPVSELHRILAKPSHVVT